MSSINSQFGVSGASLAVYEAPSRRVGDVTSAATPSSREQELANKLDYQLSRQLARIRTQLGAGNSGIGNGQVGQRLDILA